MIDPFVAGGAALLGAGVVLWKRTGRRIARMVRVNGRITSVRFEPAFGRDDTHSWFPTITYVVDGRSYEVAGGSQSRQPKVGRKVPMLIDPANPVAAMEKGSIGPWLLPMLCVFAGGGLLLRGVLGG